MKLLLPRLLLLHDSSRLYRSSACFGGDKGNCRGSSKSSCSSALLLSDAANTEDFSLILYNNPADYQIYQVCSLIKTMNHQVKRWNRSSPVKKTEICKTASQNLMPFKKTLFLIFWLGVFLLLKLEKAFWQKLPPKGSFRFNIKAGSYIGKIFYGQRRVFGRKKDFLSPKFRLTWTWPPKSPKIEGESFHSDLRSCELQ